MLNYLVVIAVLAFGTLGYTVQEVYGDVMTSSTSSLFSPTFTTERRNTSLVEATTESAAAFAERVSTLEHLTATSSLSTTDALVLRSTISDRFHEAFTAITHLEHLGRLDETAPAREIMQEAIDSYMHEAPEHTPQITRDLEVFSKYMTETLIERSVATSS